MCKAYGFKPHQATALSLKEAYAVCLMGGVGYTPPTLMMSCSMV